MGVPTGSYVELATNEEYDPATNTWVAKAPMPTTRARTAVVAVNNKIYAIGGTVSVYDASGIYLYDRQFATNEEYDPVGNSWVAKAPMPTARGLVKAAVVNGKIYAIGGGFGSTDSAINEEYDPLANSWVTKSPKPTTSGGAGIAVVNNKIYMMSGYFQVTDYVNFWVETNPNDNHEYDPSRDTPLYVHVKQ